MFMLLFSFVIVYGLFEWKRICVGFVSFVYAFIAVGEAVIKRGVWIAFTGLTPPGP
jgi:hypothetical protein